MKQKATPMELAAAQCIAEISTLKFFPGDEIARMALMKDLVRMANQPAELGELARRVRLHYNEWPGPREIRGVFCTFAKPKDGFREAGVTDAGTLASEIESRVIEAHEDVKHIASGGEMVKKLAEAKKL